MFYETCLYIWHDVFIPRIWFNQFTKPVACCGICVLSPIVDGSLCNASGAIHQLQGIRATLKMNASLRM